VNTCSIREKAELKVKQRLHELKKTGAKIAVLGCMAERLKDSLLEDRLADIVVGPDGYRSLPQLIQAVLLEGEENAMNVQLSAEETYADITPLRSKGPSAYISIMRGCNNMCSFCVVPFTRGRERSRPLTSILNEVKSLQESGVKEIYLLGQNVNSYFDKTSEFQESHENTEGFSELYRLRHGTGARFSHLLEAVAQTAPDVRIRFTSPHPKDFPPSVLKVMEKYQNVCNHIHLPLQSGSDRILQSMRRFYTQEAYLKLAEDIRRTLPGVSISTDIIAGFCGETEDDHQRTLEVVREVRFEQAFMFMYSMRSKTFAFNHFKDDVSQEVKQRRLDEIIKEVQKGQFERNKLEVGRTFEVLVEGKGKRTNWTGKTTHNKRVGFDGTANIGDLVQVKIEKVTSQSLNGKIIT
jgi:MiaB/RimO family radical SAM methylthiotransferase